MHHASRILNVAASLALTTLSMSTLAQTPVTFKSTCQDVGFAAREPLGDRDGHSIEVIQYSCRNEGGVEDGTLMTGMVIWEWDKTTCVMLSGNGVVRKPGALAVFQNSGSKASLTISDGKVTGITGTLPPNRYVPLRMEGYHLAGGRAVRCLDGSHVVGRAGLFTTLRCQP